MKRIALSLLALLFLQLGGLELSNVPNGSLNVLFQSPEEAALWLAYLGCLRLSQDEEARAACTERFKEELIRMRSEKNNPPKADEDCRK